MNAYRIGQIVPSSNTTMETESPAMLRAREAVAAERFTFHSSRARMHKVTKEELERMNRDVGRCAAELADARVELMSTACLVATMAMGHGYHRVVEEEILAAARANGSQAKVMTSAGALIDGVKALGAKRIAVMCPYTKELTKLVIGYIEAEGIEVVDSICFEIPDNLEVGRRDPQQLLEDVKRLDSRKADAVVLSACVQMQSLPAVAEAERRIGLPVTSTAVCTVWQMLDRLGLDKRVPNAGKLLA